MKNSEGKTPDIQFSDLRCLVIGGASGMGQATAERLRLRTKSLIVADITQGDIASNRYVPIDVTEEQAVNDAFAQANTRLGGIDIVVNTSGILGKIQSIEEETVTEFEQLLSVNLTGAFNVSRAAIPYLLQSKSGRLVHFSSTAGKEGVAKMPGYSASKAGIMGLVKSLAKEYAHTGLTVNAVAPGKVAGPMIAHTPPSPADLDRIPMGRLGQPHEAAALVEYIVSPEATYTTGVVFDLSGGRATY